MEITETKSPSLSLHEIVTPIIQDQEIASVDTIPAIYKQCPPVEDYDENYDFTRRKFGCIRFPYWDAVLFFGTLLSILASFAIIYKSIGIEYQQYSKSQQTSSSSTISVDLSISGFVAL